MYSTLTRYGQSNASVNHKYPCPSMPLPTYHLDEEDPSASVSFNLTPKIIPKTLPRMETEMETEMEMERTMTPLTVSSKDDSWLLPVMDPRFNLREICKQCVLLEDHLTHDEKRCTDCCTKHFLALEALAEEALTLDRQGLLDSSAKGLPNRIRQLQLRWIQNPTPSTCAHISQQLRNIRKQFQETVFPIIQQRGGCANGRCTVQTS